MKFVIPIQYLLSVAETRIIDKGLWEAICIDLDCRTEGTQFGSRNDITLEALLVFMNQEFPEGEQSLDNGLMEVEIWDCYDYDIRYILKYCKDNEIPIDAIIDPDSSTECRFYKFYRPGNEFWTIVDANDSNEAVISINRIQEIMNTAEESKTDTEIMLEISKQLDVINPHSSLNDIGNWVSL